jgi:Transposase DDE domain
MSAIEVYEQVYCMLDTPLETTVPRSSRIRLALVVTGLLRAQSAAPARVAPALDLLGLSPATAERIERRIRRFENAPHLDATLCGHPLARAPLALGKPSQLVLVLDPTSQDDRLVMLTAAGWYRGRALPVAWALWPANHPLEDERFWHRVATLLETVAALLPAHVPVTWRADRAFGTPAWLALLTAHGWHYVVRGQGQTRDQDVTGHCTRLDALVPTRGQRAKGAGQVCKKRGWRTASVLVYWGPRQDTPLALVSALPPHWAILALYRQRSPIAATFRD